MEEENTVEWKGYSFMGHNEIRTYSIKVSEEKVNELWKKFEECECQRDFYFEFVNPIRLLKEKKEGHK